VGKKVLLIEDEPNIIEAISFILKRAGWAVATHADGTTAISADAPAEECFADGCGAERQCVGLQSAWRWVIHHIESAADGAQIRNVGLSLFLTMVLS